MTTEDTSWKYDCNKKEQTIDENKIIKGQMKYVAKLMKIARESGYEKGYSKAKEDILKLQIKLSSKMSSWAEYDIAFRKELNKLGRLK